MLPAAGRFHPLGGVPASWRRSARPPGPRGPPTTRPRGDVTHRSAPGTLATVDREATIRLLCEILRGTAALPGAACRGCSGIFDDQLAGETIEEHDDRQNAALRVCRGWSARLASAGTLPARAPGRVFAGVAVQGGRLLTGPELEHPAVA